MVISMEHMGGVLWGVERREQPAIESSALPGMWSQILDISSNSSTKSEFVPIVSYNSLSVIKNKVGGGPPPPPLDM